MAKRLAQVKVETFCTLLSKIKAEAPIDTLPNRLTEVELEILAETMARLYAEVLVKKLAYVLRKVGVETENETVGEISTDLQCRTKLLENVFPIMSTFLRNKPISKTTHLRQENSLPLFNVASHKRPGIRLSFEYITTLLSGPGGEGRTGKATIFRKMVSKYRIFSTVMCKIVYKVIRVFSQEYLQGKKKKHANKKHFTKAVFSSKFHARASSHRKARPHIRFLQQPL